MRELPLHAASTGPAPIEVGPEIPVGGADSISTLEGGETVPTVMGAQRELALADRRERTGEGQLVTVNMLDAITTLQMQELSVFVAGKVPQQRSAEPHAHVYIRAPYGTFKTADGFLALAMPDLPTLDGDETVPAEHSRVHWRRFSLRVEHHLPELLRGIAPRSISTRDWREAPGSEKESSRLKSATARFFSLALATSVPWASNRAYVERSRLAPNSLRK